MGSLQASEIGDERIEIGAHAPLSGQFVCARPVPDGSGHQLFGAVFAVRADDVDEVLAWCTNHDAFGLCGYAQRSATV